MGERFGIEEDGRLSISLEYPEVLFLADMVAMLNSVGAIEDDPGEDRLNIPAYLGDDEASAEWRRLRGERLQDARSRDRDVFDTVLAAEAPVLVDPDDALAVLRVINESRLVLAARLGVEVESDYEELDIGGTVALHFLGLLIEDLTDELGKMLG